MRLPHKEWLHHLTLQQVQSFLPQKGRRLSEIARPILYTLEGKHQQIDIVGAEHESLIGGCTQSARDTRIEELMTKRMQGLNNFNLKGKK